MSEIRSINQLSFDSANPNAGSERGQAVVEESLRRLGAGRSICVDKNGKTIAGNNVLQKAVELGMDIEVVHTNGSRLVVVVRDDLDLDTDAAARELSIADNRASELSLTWKPKLLEELRMRNSKIKMDYLFGAGELQKVAERLSRRTETAQNQTQGGGSMKTVTCPDCGRNFEI